MSIAKKLIKAVPVTAVPLSWLGSQLADRHVRKVIRAIARSPYEQGAAITHAMKNLNAPLQGDEQADILKIESLRTQYAGSTELLVDGTLGEGGLHDKDRTIQEVIAVSKPPRPALFLYMLVRALRPEKVLELGTNMGVSSAFIASALLRNGKGSIHTLEASPYRIRWAQRMHKELGLSNVQYTRGLFADTLPSVLADMETVDLAFIDGHHQYQPTLDYYNMIRAYADKKTVFIFDDIRWSEGMKKAWSELQEDEHTGLAVDLNTVGLTTLRRDDIQGDYIMDELFPLMNT